MMRFYDVQIGQVLIDGVDVRDQDLTTLRRRFGVVLQDPFLFSGTIGQNIRLGSKWITDDEVANAAEEVNVADFIRTLPGGFNEPVTERGSTLSTGQKQLISFARALAHRPGILILDEATSSVDTETELRVRAALERMITGRTSVLIAHRLSHRATRRHHPRHAQRPSPRTRHSPGAPRAARPLLAPLPPPVQRPGTRHTPRRNPHSLTLKSRSTSRSVRGLTKRLTTSAEVCGARRATAELSELAHRARIPRSHRLTPHRQSRAALIESSARRSLCFIDCPDLTYEPPPQVPPQAQAPQPATSRVPRAGIPIAAAPFGIGRPM